MSDEELFRYAVNDVKLNIGYTKLRKLIKRWRASAEVDVEFGTWVMTAKDHQGHPIRGYRMDPTGEAVARRLSRRSS